MKFAPYSQTLSQGINTQSTRLTIYLVLYLKGD